MANEALGIYKKMGIGVESNWAQGTITSATELLPLRDSGISVGLAPNIIRPSRIQGNAVRRKMILGTRAPKLAVPLFGYPVGSVLDVLKAAFGTVTSTEVASFTVTLGVNDALDFKENAGAQLNATIAAGTYAMGTSSAVSGSLCEAIKTALEAAGAGTYTVTFSLTTKKVTIAVAGGGITAVQLLPVTGTNTATDAGGLIGFAADSSSSASVIADTAVVPVFDHVFTIVAGTTYGLSVGLTAQIALATGKVFDILDCVVDTLKMSYEPNSEMMWDAEMEGRSVAASGDTLSALTVPATDPLIYSQLAFTVGGVTHDCAALEYTLNNNLKKDMFVNSVSRSRFPRNDLVEISGSFTLDLADSLAYAIYDAFIAGTQPALVATFTGASGGIKTGFAYTITHNLYKVQYNLDAVPGGGGADAPPAQIPFECFDDGTNGALKVTVRNSETSI